MRYIFHTIFVWGAPSLLTPPRGSCNRRPICDHHFARVKWLETHGDESGAPSVAHVSPVISPRRKGGLTITQGLLPFRQGKEACPIRRGDRGLAKRWHWIEQRLSSFRQGEMLVTHFGSGRSKRMCNTLKFKFLEIELKWFNLEFCAHENIGK